jgi:hypothetical protein
MLCLPLRTRLIALQTVQPSCQNHHRPPQSSASKPIPIYYQFLIHNVTFQEKSTICEGSQLPYVKKASHLPSYESQRQVYCTYHCKGIDETRRFVSFSVPRCQTFSCSTTPSPESLQHMLASESFTLCVCLWNHRVPLLYIRHLHSLQARYGSLFQLHRTEFLSLLVISDTGAHWPISGLDRQLVQVYLRGYGK